MLGLEREMSIIKKAGILLPVFSLPSDYGIGCFSESAYNFVDFLKNSGQSYWQILPLCPTSYGDSPYQSPSTFAGNPYMISLKELIKEGLLTKEECDSRDFGDERYINYEKLYQNRYPLLKLAFSRSTHQNDKEYIDFINENEFWLSSYSLFTAIKGKFRGVSWTEWDEDIKKRLPDVLSKYQKELSDEIEFCKFVQFKFFSQWKALKRYANDSGIKIIGDIPIYASLDSSDVWANPELFMLDGNGSPQFVAGCPPDGFSDDGQLWGNPVYRWDAHQKDGFRWWISRLNHSLSLYDTVRIDHFRGFDEYYSIPGEMKNARTGKWEKAPGRELFSKLKGADVIAEDLGFITDSVKELLEYTGFPGMKVVEFAFDSRDSGFQSDYLPHNYPENSVCYTGTHDNEPLSSWLESISEKELKMVREYLCDEYTPLDKLNLPMISCIMQSSSKLCIIPIQDYMGLGAEARINTPSTSGSNWRWRLKKSQLTKELQNTISKITHRYGRA